MKTYKYKFNSFNDTMRYINVLSQNDIEALKKLHNIQTSFSIFKNQLLIKQEKI